MKAKTPLIFATVAIVEAIVIVSILLNPRRIEIGIYSEAVTIQDPFYWALEYESPDSKFAELAKKYPQWIARDNPAPGLSILAECLARNRTNAARILISSGANVQNAISFEREAHNEVVARELERLRMQISSNHTNSERQRSAPFDGKQ